MVYDVPQCDNLTDSILNCPRSDPATVTFVIPIIDPGNVDGATTTTTGRIRRQAGTPAPRTGALGRLQLGVTGSDALIDLVGVRCEGLLKLNVECTDLRDISACEHCGKSNGS